MQQPLGMMISINPLMAPLLKDSILMEQWHFSRIRYFLHSLLLLLHMLETGRESTLLMEAM